MMSKHPHIILGITGSIAAYKAVELVRNMTTRSWDVTVLMTESSSRYVGSLTFKALTGNPVGLGKFENLPADAFQHINAATEGDVMVIAPCTANVMAKVAHGMADDILSATVLASSSPLIIAPAMNTGMWQNPATQANLETLRQRGVRVMDVGEGELACGTTGAGRLCELDEIISAIEKALAEN